MIHNFSEADTGADFDAEAVVGADADDVAVAAHDYDGVAVVEILSMIVTIKGLRTMTKLELRLCFSYLAQLLYLQCSCIL